MIRRNQARTFAIAGASITSVVVALAVTTPSSTAENAVNSGNGAGNNNGNAGNVNNAQKPACRVDGIDPPSRRYGAMTARPTARIRAHRRPSTNAPRTAVGPQTRWSGQATRLLVLEAKCKRGEAWLRVLLPDRPNGRSGWIKREKVNLRRTPYWVDVSVDRRTATVLRDGVIVRQHRAVVGAPGTPTPRGLGAIYEIVRQPNSRDFLGSHAIHLTMHSNELFNFGGGPGRIAIHGRNGASLVDPLGSARSHGCVRINNGPVSWIARNVPAGTPVRVHRGPSRAPVITHRMNNSFVSQGN